MGHCKSSRSIAFKIGSLARCKSYRFPRATQANSYRASYGTAEVGQGVAASVGTTENRRSKMMNRPLSGKPPEPTREQRLATDRLKKPVAGGTTPVGVAPFPEEENFCRRLRGDLGPFFRGIFGPLELP